MANKGATVQTMNMLFTFNSARDSSSLKSSDDFTSSPSTDSYVLRGPKQRNIFLVIDTVSHTLGYGLGLPYKLASFVFVH